ncbi:hypothetical protein L9F63_007384, partial [Diploptera punctata]
FIKSTPDGNVIDGDSNENLLVIINIRYETVSKSTKILIQTNEEDPSKWLACLSEGSVGTCNSGETMWLLDLSQPALTHQECGKLMCFRYYSGLSLSCLAQSETMTVKSICNTTSVKNETLQRSSPVISIKKKSDSSQAVVKRREFSSSDLMRVRGSKAFANNSSESDSEVETSAKYRKQRSARQLKKKSALVHPPDKRLANGYPPHLNGSGAGDESDGSEIPRELHTWNSHECAQRTLDLGDKSHPTTLNDNVDYYPIWTKSPLPSQIRSIYETLYPSSDPPPPPLPPRAFPPGSRNSRHRPLERMRALPYQVTLNPPEVLRQHKPVSGPTLPPKPRKLLNPEDSFAFEIIDTDELRPSFSSHNNVQVVSCTRMKEMGNKKTEPQRPMNLAVNGDSNRNETENFPVVSAPLATPEQDSSLVDSSSVENLLDDEDDAVFLTPDDEGASYSYERSTVNFKDLPNPSSSSISPVSPNSMSDSGMVLSTATECSTSSSSDTNTMVLTDDNAEFVDASSEEPGALKSPTLRGHKPLSRQVSHPPFMQSPVRLPLQRQIGNEAAATTPRPHNSCRHLGKMSANHSNVFFFNTGIVKCFLALITAKASALSKLFTTLFDCHEMSICSS